MKRIISLVLILSMVLTFSACNKKVEEDPITMYVGMGNNSTGYYLKIRELIKEKLGYDVEFVSFNTMDTTNALVDRARNNDLPADIVITASKMPDDVAKSAFVDFNSSSNLPDLFVSSQLKTCYINGSEIYQLPFTSRLIGIEYNKTLLEEYGWELPSNLDEMIALKEEVEAAGVKFAVTGGGATGHGFNYLFHLMGSEFIFTPDGEAWYEEFMSGESDVDTFKTESSYFEKYKEAGLFGDFEYGNWSADKVYTETRALFYYNILDNVYSYDGFQYDDDGKIVGATYEGGEVVAVEDDNGNAVLVDDKYVWYDEDNAEYEGLQRYTIEGAKVLHDEFGSMPWLAEDGQGNYTIYNNMYISLDKDLLNDSDKFNKCIEILEVMASEEAGSIYKDIVPDGYSSTNTFDIDDTRLYADYAKTIEEGNLQPWYYNDFDADSIVNVGQLVNDYIYGINGVTFDDIFEELTYQRDATLKKVVEYCGTVTSTLSYEDSAKLQCVANGLSAQAAVDEAGLDYTVNVSILPYVDDISDIPAEGEADDVQLPLVQEKFYKGKIETSSISKYINNKYNNSIIVAMTGLQINEFVEAGFNAKESYGYDHTYKLMMVTKGGISLVSDKVYYVVIPVDVLGAELYDYNSEVSLILKADDKDITSNTVEGLKTFFEENGKVSKEIIKWN